MTRQPTHSADPPLTRFLTELRERLLLTPEAFTAWLRITPDQWRDIITSGIPPKDIEAWSDHLPLDATARQHFHRLAWLDHAPVIVREYVRELEDQVEQLTARRDEPDLDLINSLLAEEGDRLRDEATADLLALVDAGLTRTNGAIP